ncbi:MAG: PAS domain S-box protein [Deltaproteobacteria bacterium]|nr:PAS domain S-box protein [Kofleriaceae bacterium]
MVAAATFALDLLLPRGYAGAAPYVIVIALGLWVPWRQYPLVAAGATTALALVALPFKEQGAPAAVIVANRAFALVAMWAVAFAVAKYLSVALAIRDDRARMRAILETSADGLVTIDVTGRIELFNRAAERIFGRAAVDVLGHDVAILMPPPHGESLDGHVRRWLAGGEVEGVRTDGSRIDLDLAVADVALADRRVFTASVRDITERKRAEAEREALVTRLEQKNAELERFTYTVSHDLKSPLVTVRGFLGTLERSAREGNFERLTSDIARIAGAADRMRDLLDDLLELSRIGRVANAPRDVPFGALVRDAVEALNGSVRNRGVEIAVAPDLPVVRGDATRLTEVVQNLVENAVKFMGDQPAPRIEIGVRRDDAVPVFYVNDNGIGIDARYHEKIFGLFEQLRRGGEGTGVGLALVRRIIDVHGGRIWVESGGVGDGSRFCFTLPVADERSQDVQHASP